MKKLLPLVFCFLSSAIQAQATPPVSGYAGWWRADLGVVTDASGNVQTWQDQSGNARHFEQTDVNKRPALVPLGIGAQPSLRFDGSNDGLLGVSGMNFARPSTVFVVFERLSEEAFLNNGYIIQSSASPHWFMRSDGFHSGAWVRQVALPAANEETVAVMTNGPASTTVHVNGSDWTHSSTPATGAPGRLALGGSTGSGFDPLQQHIAEVIVYDRVLSAGEREDVEAYLAARYGFPVPSVATPIVSPPSQIVSASTTVSLSVSTTGAEIRYTTDGSEPTATSTLYSAAFSVPAGTTVKARGFKSGRLSSPIGEGIYTASATMPFPTSGLTLWTRADQGVTHDALGAVQVWQDLSGAGNHFSQGTQNQQPKLKAGSLGGQSSIAFDGEDDGLWAPSTMALGRASTVFVVFERESTEDFYVGGGYVLQNSANPRWYMRTNGFYSGTAFIRDAFPQRSRRTVAVMTNSPTSTRVHVNGSDWTQDSSPTTGTPGRLALGGGNGHELDPHAIRVAEVIAFSDALTDAERVRVEEYLAARYALPDMKVSTPVISPASQIVSASTSVTLTCATIGAEIRYTTDGSEPTAGSALYSGSFSAAAGSTVRARAFKVGQAASSIVDAVYTASASAPLATSGLKMWLRADQGFTQDANGVIERWADLSGNANDLRQGIDERRPAREEDSMHGAPAIFFDGNDDGMLGGELMNFQRPSTVFVVFERAQIFDFYLQGGYVIQGNTTPHWFIRTDGYHSGNWVKNVEILRGAETVAVMTNSATGTTAHANGVNITQTANLTTGVPGRLAVGGGEGHGYDPLQQRIAEVIVYDYELNATERQAVESYLSSRYAIGSGALDLPSISHTGGTYSAPISVTLSHVTSGVTLRYTTDGSAPTASSTAYTAAIALSEDTHLRVRAFKAGSPDSGVADAVYDFVSEPAYVGLWSSAAGGNGNRYEIYTSSIPVSWTLADATATAMGGHLATLTSAAESEFVYQLSLQAAGAYTAFAGFGPLVGGYQPNGSTEPAGGWTWVNGEGLFSYTDWIPGEPNNGNGNEHYLQLYQRTNNRSNLWADTSNNPPPNIFGAFSYVVEFESATAGTAAPVLADKPSGSYDRSVTVALASSTAGATLRYTTDGSSPDGSSPVFSSALVFNSTSVLRTRAFAAGLSPSAIATYVYEVTPAPVVAGVLFNESAITSGQTFIRSGTLSVDLVSSQSVEKVSFLRQSGTDTPVLIGEDTYFADGIGVPWSLLTTPDGSYTLITRVYDGLPTPVDVTLAVNVALAPPQRPAFTFPADGTVTTLSSQALGGTASDDATLVLFRNGVELLSNVTVATNDTFSVGAALLPNVENIFTLQSTNRSGSSQLSLPRRVVQQQPPPTLAISPSIINLAEGQSMTLTVTASAAAPTIKAIELLADTTSELTYPDLVVIPANQTSVSFTLTATQDTVIEPTSTFTLSAYASGYTTGSRSITVTDDDAPALDIAYSISQVAENAGAGAVIASFTRTPLNAQPLTLQLLLTGNAGVLSVPGSVTIPALSNSVAVPISVLDDLIADGTQVVSLQTRLLDAGGAVLAQSPARSITVTDDEGPQLAISFASSFVREGLGVTATVTRTPATASGLLVNIAAAPTGQLSTPSQVTIPANQASVSFTIIGTEDGVSDGVREIALTATASGYQSAQGVLTVTDELLPDFTFTALTHAASAGTEDTVPVTWTIKNAGLLPHTGPVIVRTFLSTDDQPGDDDYLGSYTYDGGLAVNGTFTRTESFRMPRASGDYWFLIIVDQAETVNELVETNNSRLSATPIVLAPAYSAVVSTTTTLERMGREITLTGSATLTAGGPAANSQVDIELRVQGTKRTISVITDAAGAFTYLWSPLMNEAGQYTIAAKHPGELGDAPVQDQFTLVGLTSDVEEFTKRLIVDDSPFIQSITIRNPGDTQLTGVTAQMLGVAAGVTATASVINATLPGLSSTTVNLSLSLNNSAPNSSEMTLRLTSTQGALLDIPVKVGKAPALSQLSINPMRLANTALRGEQTIIDFEITNVGSQSTQPITLLMPGTMPWFTPLTAMPMAALAPGQIATVSLQVAPPTSTPLGHSVGNLVVRGAAADVSLPFDLNITTNVLSSIVVRCENESTYYTQGSPLLQNATAKLLNSQTGATIATASSGTTGIATLSGLQPGIYILQVTAPQHGAFQKTVVVPAGAELNETAFLQFLAINYTWNVVPTQVPDVTKLTLTTTFETNVPKPVVTIEPNHIVLSENDPPERQVIFTLTNHGLIRADDVKLNFTASGPYSVEILSSDLGDLAAKTSITVPAIIRYNPNASSASGGCCTGSSSKGGVGISGSFTSSESESGLTSSGGITTASGCPVMSGGAAYSYICGPGSQGGAAAVLFEMPEYLCPGGLYPLVFATGGSPWGPGGAGGYGTTVSCSPLPQPGISLGGGGGTTVGYNNTNPPTLFPPSIPPLIDFGSTGAGPFMLRADWVRSMKDLIGHLSDEDKIGLGLSIFDDELTSAFGGSTGQPPCCVTPNAVGISPLITLEQWNGSTRTVRELYEHLFGDPAWVARVPDQSFFTFMAAFYQRISSTSEEQTTLSSTEIAFLQALPPPTGITPAQVTTFLQRWNRSLEYWSADIYTLAQVPVGQSTDFITLDGFQQRAQDIIDAYACSQQLGYDSPFEGYEETKVEAYQFLTQGGGVCARVKLQIDQEAVLSRDAFHASLTLNNLGDVDLESVTISLQATLPNGTPANLGQFQFEAPVQTGFTGPQMNTLVQGGTGTFDWTIIPTDLAAPTVDTAYLIGGTVSYIKGGELVEFDMAPAPITARPIPNLSVKYFMQRDVFSDDPHTDAIEPSIPFSLGVMVENTGAGIANALTLESSQPRIIENEKGLLIDFNILSTEVGGVAQAPGLKADFGDIGAGQRKVGRWLMTSSLHGHFIDYKAEMQHQDIRGSTRPPLITSTEIHEMIRSVRADRVTDDALPDFLVNDVPDIADLPDRLHLSTGGIETVSTVITPNSSTAPSAGQLSVPLTASMPAGWSYLTVLEPSNGSFQLTGITRSDGKVILMNTNAWVTDRTFIGFGTRPIRENKLHLLDHNSTGSYTLHYAAIVPPDTTPPTSSITALPAQSRQSFSLSWTGSDNVAVSRYDVFVSTNGGAFTQWLASTELTSAIYLGAAGQTYAFYSIAIDSSGNSEAASGIADASTTTSIVNQPPVLDAIPAQVTNEGDTLTVQISATDPDSSGPISYSLGAGAPAGVIVDASTGLLSWITGENDGGSSPSVTVVASDNTFPEGTASRSFTIQVLEQNSPPTLTTPVSYTYPERTPISFELPGQDPDQPSQNLTWALTGTVPGGAMLNPALGIVTWTTPNVEDTTEIAFNYTVTDDGSPPLVTAGQVILRIIESSAAPELTLSSAALTYSEDQPPLHVAPDAFITDADSPHFATGLLTVNLSAGASEGDHLIITPGLLAGDGEVTLASNAVSVDGTLVGQLNTLSDTSFTVTMSSGATPVLITRLLRHVTFVCEDDTPATSPRTLFAMITDGDNGSSIPATRLINVTATDDAPKAAPDSHMTIVDTLIRLSHLLENDTDAEDEPLSLTLPSAISTQGGSVTISSGVVTYTPPSGFTGTDTFTYTLTAGTGTATGTVTMQVVPASQYVFPVTEIAPSAGGSFTFEVKDVPGRTYNVNVSDNLTDWNFVGTATADSTGTLRYTDNTTVGEDARFYQFEIP